MSDEHENEPDSPDGASVERWGWIAWGILIVVALALYELLHQPALLGATVSLKFAWGDARTAFWLRTRDPDRPRGWAHFWLYLGLGLWKSAICGIALTFVFMALDQFVNGRANNRPQAGRNDTLVLIFAGSCSGSLFMTIVSGFVCCVGFVLAFRAKIKVWLHSRVAASRVRDRWPPIDGDENQLPHVAIPSIVLIGTILSTALAIGLIFLLGNLIKPRAQAGVGVLIFSASLVILSWIMIKDDRFRRRLQAASPEDAWPEPRKGDAAHF